MGSIYGLGIQTKYLGPTNYRPSRISAWATDGPTDKRERITVSYDDYSVGSSCDGRNPHERAVRAWIEKYGTHSFELNGETVTRKLFGDAPFVMIAAGTVDGYFFSLVPEYALHPINSNYPSADELLAESKVSNDADQA